MSTVSAYELYIITNWVKYVGTCGNLSELFTDKAEAERIAAERSVGKPKIEKHAVMTLSDYIDELKSEARSDGVADERESQRWQ
jgi:hypothetical protein